VEEIGRSGVERSGMCGIVGFLRKTPASPDLPVGSVALQMLRALSTRGPDSAGLAVFGEPRDGDLKVRVQSGGGPVRDAAVVAAVRAVAEVRAVEHRDGCLRLVTGPADAANVEAAILEADPEAEVFSIGARLELAKQTGHPDQLREGMTDADLRGSHVVGHTRLSTESRVDVSHSQPFWAHGEPDLALAHNGHITNYHKLRRRLEHLGHRFYTENDSEVIGPYLRERLRQGDSLTEAMERSTRELDGTFCYVVASAEGLGFVKDFFCSKPLVLAETDDYVAIATEELAIRSALPEAPPVVEPGACAVRFWRAQ
jgi:glutamate synthase domain-containing protein 1